jgi:tRNA-Thr(GGU) m(6)t(6)A37 methyltransferase TsaA
MKDLSLQPIGVVHSTIKKREDAPLFYDEGAPPAVLEIFPDYVQGLERLQVGDEIVVITWLHAAQRDVLKVHPRRNPANPVTGVFLTRSPDRPNPLGLHRVTVVAIEGRMVRIGAIEAIDGTPVVDIKAVVMRKISEAALLRLIRLGGFIPIAA